VFAAIEDDAYVGTYFIRPNHAGPASHIANAGYAVVVTARGRGLAKAMCLHSLDRARESGFRAMQFNMVVAANPAAHAAWTACGFEDVGVLKQAFNHPRLGYVDAHIMYRLL
jgi:RimJ/RimL family protein N-acetyltransferase